MFLGGNSYLLNLLQQELQRRIGTLPCVEISLVQGEDRDAEVTECLLVQPKSLSEISRAVRAAKTMRLNVRTRGRSTSGVKGLYADQFTLLVDCQTLNDTPRIELTTVIADREIDEQVPCLRILVSVGIDELLDFQINNRIELTQPIDESLPQGTVVGALVSKYPVGEWGVKNGPQFFAQNRIFCVRVVDSKGDLCDYTGEQEVNYCKASLGMLGIVYDVFLEYHPMSMSKVSAEIHTWNSLLSSDLLYERLTESSFVEILYLPYCSINLDEPTDDRIKQWSAKDDEVLLRCGKTAHNRLVECDPIDSTHRKQIHILDPVVGPRVREFFERPEETPELLAKAFVYVKREVERFKEIQQYTPWAVNMVKIADLPTNSLRLSMTTGSDLKEFKKAMEVILSSLTPMTAEDGRLLFPVNYCIRIHLPGLLNPHNILDISNAVKMPMEDWRQPFIVCLIGFQVPLLTSSWQVMTCQLIRSLCKEKNIRLSHLKEVCHDTRLLSEVLHMSVEESSKALKKKVASTDRDGIFFTKSLAHLLNAEIDDYRLSYRQQRDKLFSHLLKKLSK
ncbi:unnamed protein product [Schistocephalus solidus]|uniref:FAD-binding PCMH-type domain-containing protein n=1 Tax=Schistocephalus solidus TaxID=70667 RepID=A0A183T3E1_SCHSO|nr:unnamed protein product [Schistocephalus solidus]